MSVKLWENVCAARDYDRTTGPALPHEPAQGWQGMPENRLPVVNFLVTMQTAFDPPVYLRCCKHCGCVYAWEEL